LPGSSLGTVKVELKLPVVSATGESTTVLLKLTWTVSPGRKPPPVTVTEVPGGPCSTESESTVPAIVKLVRAVPPLWPVAITGYWSWPRFE
jgi:hypothetical protein